MRITNNMVATQSLNNIWRNSRHVNGIIQSIETGKVIQRPSDNPLLSGRVLRFRTLISETEQFIRNAHTGMSWMEVSENAFDNLLTGNNSIMARMNVLMLAAVDGSYNLENVRAATDEIRELFEQLKFVEMNQTYMGRFVFSGFHTDRPPVLTSDMPDRTFVMQHRFDIRDIESITTFHRQDINSPLTLHDTNIIKLPFTGNLFDQLLNTSFTPAPAPIPPAVPHPGIFDANGNPIFHIRTISIDHPDAYNPSTAVWPGPAGVPPVYFDPRNPGLWAAESGWLDYADFVETDPTTWPPDTNPDDLVSDPPLPLVHFIPETGELVMSDAARTFFDDNTTITFQKTGFEQGDLNPMINFRSWDVTDDPDFLFFNAPSHNFRLEIATNSHVTINSHASNILTPQMYADFMNLFRFIESLQPSSEQAIRAYFQLEHGLTDAALEHYVSEFMSDEAGAISSMIYIRFNNMIELWSRHATAAQAEHTALGSRMTRLEMLQTRLEEDEIAYMALRSEAEDTDIPAAIMRRNNSEVAFNNALRAVAAVNQLSLADFINR